MPPSLAMYTQTARFYDVIHDATGRDATLEADIVVGELRRWNRHANTLLDVACGTGAHLPRFGATFEVEGVDLSADMLAFAAVRCPGAILTQADMRDFELDRHFDAVVCLFSGIGYLTERVDLEKAITTMAAHLNPGGVLMIEGWIEPDYWIDSMFNAQSGRNDDLAVARVVRSHREGMGHDIFMRYVVASADEITTVDEIHAMRLSDPDEFEAAFDSARLAFERLPHMLHQGRSVYVGTNIK